MALMIAPFLFIAAVLYTAYPLLREGQGRTHIEKRENKREKLLEEKDSLIVNLKDIEMDYRMGKLSQDDYGELKADFEQRAVKVFQRLESFQKRGKSKGKK